ncbi:MAG: AAA family ATPase, partial [Actinobacteria bacterium]|nr:AAA family ATPase [Actinomycetota bacterium]
MVTGEVVGRETELAVLAEFLAAAEAWPRTLVLEGEAGAGKTTLWQTAIEDARVEFRVLATRPLETEAKLAFAGVGDLLDGVHDTFGGLQEPQAQALRAALLLESPAAGSVDERAVALGFLGVLRLLATEQPVLIAVDDLQWLDLPSARVLAFAGSRLGEVRAGFLIALRAEERWRLAFAPERILPACTQLPIGGLTFDAIHQLLRARLGLVLSRPALRLVHETAAGNPFFALELARAAAAKPTAHLPGETLHVPLTVRELVGARVAEQPVETRRALLTVAALADPRLDLVSAAIAGDAAATLDPAVVAEIVSVVGSRIRFTHPLLAAAAYEAAVPGERRKIHAALATLLGDREEQVRHLALATDGPDANVAAALDEAAALARARGAP